MLAAFVVASWVAIGSTFLGSLENDDPVAAPLSLLIGSGLTSFLLALFAAAGHVTAGVLLCALICVIALVLQGRRTLTIASAVRRSISEIAQNTATRVALALIGIVAWISAISPPRSADAMRYHLAHIRQIVGEGRWVPIADYHYALPFGWTLSFLPFELLGLVQGAQLLGVLLFALMLACVASLLRSRGVSNAAILGALLMLLHPAVLRAFSEAGTDGYSLIAMLVIAGVLMRMPQISTREGLLLGFASWIGIQSRYQLVAAGIACAIVVAIYLRNIDNRPRFVRNFVIGAAAAALLASPFYVANARAFGNPVWPLMIPKASIASNYADAVSYYYSKSLTGNYSPREIVTAFWTLATTPFVFPLSILAIAFVAIAAVSRGKREKAVALFGSVFFILWLAMAPELYPRFVLMMVPCAVLSAGFVLDRWLVNVAPRRWRQWTTVFALGAVLLATISVFTFRDNIRYIATGDSSTYHRFTWFYPVYEWINKATPAESRFLVVLSSETTYYLDRPYRRADPWISGVVDWNATGTGDALDQVLTRGGYSYMLYEDRNWNDFRGGKEMHTAVEQAIGAGTLVPVRKFNERLYTSRLWRDYTETTVYLLQHESRDRKLSSVRQ